jgi:hypothetical protein
MRVVEGQLALFFGAAANFIAVWPVSWTGSEYSVSAFVAVSGFVGFVATLAFKDKSNERLTEVGTVAAFRRSRLGSRQPAVSSASNALFAPGA